MDKTRIEQAETELVNQSLNLLHQRLGSFLGLHDNPETLNVLHEIAAEKFTTQMNSMNVADELLRLKPIGSDTLRSYLLEREREALPMLRLKDNDRHDNPQHYVRLIGIAGGDAHPLVKELNTHSLELRDKPYLGVDTGDPDSLVLMTIRNSIPVSYIENFSNYEAAYKETARDLKEEKYHRAIWRRFMPLPGEDVDEAKTKRYLTMAVVAERLDIQVRGSVRNVLLKEYDPYNPRNPQPKTVTLGSSLEEIRAILQNRFDLRVEIWSLFWPVGFQQNGPHHVEAELLKFDQIVGSPPSNDLPSLLGSMVDHETIQQLLKDLDWVKDQVTPAAMFYYKR